VCADNVARAGRKADDAGARRESLSGIRNTHICHCVARKTNKTRDFTSVHGTRAVRALPVLVSLQPVANQAVTNQ